MDSPSQAACSARSSLAPQGRASRRRASAARPAVRLASLTVSLRSAAVLQASKRPASKGGDNVRKPMAAAGTAVFFVLAPGVVAGLLPWWLTGWRVRQPLPWWAWAPLRVAGGVLIDAGVAAFVHGYEEPTLRRQFGAQYQAYQRAVPAWWPRRRPWQPDQTDQP